MCLEVRDRSSNQPSSSVGDLGQPCLDLFFEAAEETEVVECHHGMTEAGECHHGVTEAGECHHGVTEAGDCCHGVTEADECHTE